MSVEIFDLAASIIVTPAASRHLSDQLKRSGSKGVRISLKESGCSGYSYVIDGVDAPGADDVEIALDNGIVLFVERQALPALQGTEIDYAQEGVNYTLKLNNPNIKSECGCGESFTL